MLSGAKQQSIGPAKSGFGPIAIIWLHVWWSMLGKWIPGREILEQRW